ncbi:MULTISPECIES: hypothetical protein [Metabacillus]|uniref:Uncharacterized protein n=2 Tax=Metabacillus TaxID=2675233 RepID=A0A179SP45_9BACI|nr:MULTISPECIES: hypothetical protein [Metabacillus]OAS82760.1 hypothetical protein A6K24_11605 [Metabacillus litoralis]QNF30201.1 hypothetical protein HUW50_23720 [Metabacillus sp. KUDC1714]
MLSKRHTLFNVILIVVPWLSLICIGKHNLKRFSLAGIVIVILEIINHKIGQKRNWWTFYDKRKSFLTNELPFSIGPYMPLSLWLLKLSYGNFKKFVLLNVIADGLFAFPIINFIKKIKILRLNKLNNFQFFLYLHYKAYILYGVQYWYDNKLKYQLGIK